MLAFAALVVLATWKLLAFIDEYIADFQLARRLGTAAAMALATIAVLSPPAFAAGTTRYIDGETRRITEWFVDSIRDAVNRPEAPPPPPSSTTTVP